MKEDVIYPIVRINDSVNAHSLVIFQKPGEGGYYLDRSGSTPEKPYNTFKMSQHKTKREAIKILKHNFNVTKISQSRLRKLGWWIGNDIKYYENCRKK